MWLRLDSLKRNKFQFYYFIFKYIFFNRLYHAQNHTLLRFIGIIREIQNDALIHLIYNETIKLMGHVTSVCYEEMRFIYEYTG